METLEETDLYDKTLTKKKTLWTSQFIYIFIANFFFFLSFEMLLPTLPVYISECGGKDSIIGMVMGVFTISAIIIRPFSETALPGFTRKKSLIFGAWICTIATIGYYLSETIGIILVTRILHGFGFGLVTTLLATMATDLIPNERMGEGIGYFGLGSTIAMSLGSFLGIWVLNSFEFKGLFTFAAISIVIGVIFMHLLSKGKEAKISVRENKKFKLNISDFFERKALVPAILTMLLGFSYGGILAFIALFGIQVGISNVGWFFMGVAICEMIVRLFVGKIFDTKGPVWVLIPGAIFALIGTVILAKTSNTTTLIISSLFYGLGFGSIFPSLQALTISIVPEDRRNIASATFYNAFDLGIGGGTVILGLVVQLTNYSDMFLYSSLLFVLYLIVYVSYLFKNKQQEVK